MDQRSLNKVRDAVERVTRNLRHGSVRNSLDFAFDEGYKLYISLEVNLFSDEIIDVFKKELSSYGINSEIVYNGLASASSLQTEVIIWKKEN